MEGGREGGGGGEGGDGGGERGEMGRVEVGMGEMDGGRVVVGMRGGWWWG